MPMPLSNLDAFLETVRKSGLLDEGSLQQYLARLQNRGQLPDDARLLANCMVRDAILSQFQADQLVAGKWRGFHVAKYKVLEKIGIGGMGQVYLAEHKIMRHRVALKVLPRSKSADPSSLERFYREAKAGAALDHPNIVRAFDIDFDQSSDLHYLVMEYVDGVSMQDLVKLKGPMEANRAAHYIYQTALGLEHAHGQSLIHRDIKPSNILVERGGTLKILDMGLARFFNDDQDMITKKYDESVLGTADYLAPEQAVDSHAVDTRADIYSLGCTFYFMLTGQPPFGEGSVAQKLIWHQTRRPRSVREHRPDLPEDIVAILEKMMAKSPAERFQTPREVADALHHYGELAVPPPSEDELPKLSPLARQTPDVKRAENAAGAAKPRGGSSFSQSALAVRNADDELEDIAAELRGDSGQAPTKRGLESLRETPSPTKPDRQAGGTTRPSSSKADSGPNRFGNVSGRTGQSAFELGPRRERSGEVLPSTVKTHRDALPPGYDRRPAEESRQFRVDPELLAKYKWYWLSFAIVIVLILIALNIYLVWNSMEGNSPRRRGRTDTVGQQRTAVARQLVPGLESEPVTHLESLRFGEPGQTSAHLRGTLCLVAQLDSGKS